MKISKQPSFRNKPLSIAVEENISQVCSKNLYSNYGAVALMSTKRNMIIFINTIQKEF